MLIFQTTDWEKCVTQPVHPLPETWFSARRSRCRYMSDTVQPSARKLLLGSKIDFVRRYLRLVQNDAVTRLYLY